MTAEQRFRSAAMEFVQQDAIVRGFSRGVRCEEYSEGDHVTPGTNSCEWQTSATEDICSACARRKANQAPRKRAMTLRSAAKSRMARWYLRLTVEDGMGEVSHGA